MKLAFIAPTSYLEKYATQGDIYLALAHLIDNEGQNEYARFHRREAEKGRRVILDNGLFEGAQVSTEALLQRARAIQAQVVCAPDVLYDSAGTIKAFKQFIRDKQEFGLVCEVMGIPQASTPDDWWDCYRQLDLSSNCDLIGLSILSIPKAFGDLVGETKRPITDSRMYLIRQLFTYKKLLGRRLTPLHMLGLGETLGDITYAKRVLPNEIVSNDSSSAFVCGMHGVRYTSSGYLPGGKIHQKLNFNTPKFNSIDMPELFREKSEDLEANIQHNIKTALDLAHSQWNDVWYR